MAIPNPMEEVMKRYIKIEEETIFKKASYCGDWVLAYSSNDLELQWKRAIYLYRSLELKGILYMDCSTSASLSTSSSGAKTGEIRFMCGPSNQKEAILAIGKTIRSNMQYYSSRGVMEYIAHQDSEGGQPLYTLQVPTEPSTANSDKEKIYDDKTTTYSWKLFYPTNFTQKYAEALEVYRNDELQGIRSIEQGYELDEAPGDDHMTAGVIYFLCCPHDNLKSVIQCGQGLYAAMEGQLLADNFIYTTYDNDERVHCNASGQLRVRRTEVQVSLLINSSTEANGECLTLNPLNETTERYLREKDRMLVYEQSKLGFWMLFYNNDDMYDEWQKAVKLYRSGKLPGVQFIRCSTSAPNPRAHQADKGVIMFVCGHRWDTHEERVTLCGETVVARMNYRSNGKYVAYKKYEQACAGTKSTGERRNYSLRVQVSPESSYVYRNWKQRPVQPQPAVRQTAMERDEVIASQYPDDELGVWEIVLRSSWMLPYWKRATCLYRNNKLPGVAYLKMDSILAAPRRGFGIIRCYAGPVEDKELAKECGKILAAQMKYFSKDQKMSFFPDETAKIPLLSIEIPGNMRR